MSVHTDNSQDSIPSTWVLVRLGEIATWGSGGTPSSTVQHYYDGDIPWLVIGDLNDGYIYDSKRRISEAGLENSSAKIVSPNNVLIAMYGSIGKLGINKIPIATNQAIAFTHEISPYVLNKYLFYNLLYLRNKLQSLGKGGAQKNISQSLLKEVEILLAPTDEQQRIVAKIEELFSELDKGIEYLKTAQEQLKVYRQSVLKYAFEGKLTEEWREAHANQLETAGQLLERIQQERENLYQQQLNEWEDAVKVWEENGKESKKPNKPRVPVEVTSLTEEELLQLPQLPEGWCWARIKALGEVQLGRQRSPQNRSRDYPTKYIRAANITEDGFDLTDVMDMDFKPHELERYQLKYGDILLSEASGSADQAGKPALWRDQIPNCCFQNTVIRFQPIYLSGEYTLNVFRCFYFNKIFSKVASGVGINHLSASKFSALPVPLAPFEEQHEIVQTIDLNLSIQKQLKAMVRTVFDPKTGYVDKKLPLRLGCRY